MCNSGCGTFGSRYQFDGLSLLALCGKHGCWGRSVVIMVASAVLAWSSPSPMMASQDVRVTALSASEMVIEFIPNSWQIIPEYIEGNSYYRLQFDHSSFNRSEGEPLIPARLVIVGVPKITDASIERVEAEPCQIMRGKLLPCPGTMGKFPATARFIEDSSIYRAADSFPERLVEVSAPALSGDLSVIVIRFFPVQFYPAQEQIVLYRRIEARISFREQTTEPKRQRRPPDLVHQRLVINPESATWASKGSQPTTKNLAMPLYRNFYKIWIRDEGIYQLRGEDLQAIGIDLRSIRPENIKMYNNGGEALPRSLYQPRHESLVENAIWIEDGQDGSFDLHDFILFYAKSVNGWKYDREQGSFSHYLHPYCQENIYWLSWDSTEPGRRIIEATADSFQTPITIDFFCDLLFIEDEQYNILNSGPLWLGSAFSADIPERDFVFNLSGAMPEQELRMRINLAGITGGAQQFSCYFNDQFIAQFPAFYGSSNEYLNITLQQFTHRFRGAMSDGTNRLTLRYTPSNSSCLAYLDWIELNVHRKLIATQSQLFFYGPDSSGYYRYELETKDGNEIQVYDITNFADVKRMKIWRQGSGKAYFFDAAEQGSPRRYAVVPGSSYKKPVKIERDIASNWRDSGHEADFIIICYDDFYEAAQALKSLRENCDSLLTAVVKISDIYDEFSWGLTDPTAIRDFIQYAYQHWQRPPRYVLLLGDGDYDYKNRLSPHDPNWIPAFETEELRELASRTRDDWYVCVQGEDNLMDLAIGRIPARNPDEAMAVVQKIIHYENSPPIGEWCNTITLVADDEFGAAGQYDPLDHIPDMEAIAAQFIPDRYDVNKVYLTEYPIGHDALVADLRKPGARHELMRLINRGSLVINFIGHGNEQVWTHERILNSANDLSSIENDGRQAIWIAATCNFARFDHPLTQSFAERLLVMPTAGAIAVISTVRLAEPFANVSLNRALCHFLFDRSETPVRLGDVLMLAKNSTGNGTNDQLFHLLGDPTLRVLMPQCDVRIHDLEPDSLIALSKMTVKGRVRPASDTTMTLPGRVIVKAFDSERDREYRVNQWKTYHYVLPGGVLFRGEVSLSDGEYIGQFIVPKDISYGAKNARLSTGYFDDHVFGATAMGHLTISAGYHDLEDRQGPNIIIGFEGVNFIPGGFVPSEPVLTITLVDSLSGINIAGDIGHRIIMICDDDAHPIDLTDFFQYDRDSYYTGRIRYLMGGLAEGFHQVRIKAWDNCNNSSVATADFFVTASDRLVLRDVFNFPNPFVHGTEFTFWVNQDCDVEIKIFTLSGRLIARLDQLHAQMGFNHFYWDGRDEDGDPLANGVYLYKIWAKAYRSDHLLQVEQIEKCVMMR